MLLFRSQTLTLLSLNLIGVACVTDCYTHRPPDSGCKYVFILHRKHCSAKSPRVGEVIATWPVVQTSGKL